MPWASEGVSGCHTRGILAGGSYGFSGGRLKEYSSVYPDGYISCQDITDDKYKK